MGNFGRRATCEMVRDMCGQMARLATEEGLDVLAYTLGMTSLEAANILMVLDEERQEAQRPPLIPAAGCEPRPRRGGKPAVAVAI